MLLKLTSLFYDAYDTYKSGPPIIVDVSHYIINSVPVVLIGASGKDRHTRQCTKFDLLTDRSSGFRAYETIEEVWAMIEKRYER